MTSEEVRDFIYKRREQKYTFEDIADELNSLVQSKEYSRQSVHGLYKRYVKRLALQETIGLDDYDAINFYCRTGSLRGAQLNMELIGCPMSSSKASSIKDKYRDTVNNIDSELEELTYDSINDGDSTEELRAKLSYKGCSVSNRVYEQLVYVAYKRKIKEDIEKRICESVRYNTNKKVAKRIMEDCNMEDSITVILNRLDSEYAEEHKDGTDTI